MIKTSPFAISLEKICQDRGLRLTDQRKVIVRLLEETISDTKFHPDVDEIFNRAVKIDKKISVATVYRTVKLLEENGIIEKHDFKAGKARYEVATENHHDHLIDVNSGEIIEFVDDEIETLKKKIAKRLGYELIDHRLELYCKKK
ncbi:MAG: transcriptional repressor [Pelagibacteraceae bacterium]|jgi:Fur family ferric uptake transcriptional regulator|uniref:Fur family transcriptional regulator n=1 Tax=unclassified Candidatus Pelagibacter TaxID=2647897 RepID=UPI0001BB48FF|nr:Fe2+/Zn2+ uptake regulation protein [alpha proteobacterium HIMB114]MAV49120.1 transcriptional repressor [Pelagibacteraceae bacterium]OUV88406.1 MAG: transcriptional repressor [Pelagibacteraceae bacterium TMED146]RZO93247.1 MAG: transcriptional repressor [alpha proteobacterium HIMB114]|tara:strand:+ start:81 stop:515 length:435 start_codon:yes stop_codon:yes gene_type:complete